MLPLMLSTIQDFINIIIMNNDKVSRNPVYEAGTLKAMHTPNLKVMFSAHILIKKKIIIYTKTGSYSKLGRLK